jgi:hypothetical protein
MFMMKTINRVAVISALMMFAAPSYSANVAQVWQCEMDEGTTEETVEEMAGKWLKAAKGMKGGENLEAYVYFPVAVNDTGDVDFRFVVIAPTFEEWGKFWDVYDDDSPAALVDSGTHKLFACPNSALWQSVKVE